MSKFCRAGFLELLLVSVPRDLKILDNCFLTRCSKSEISATESDGEE